MCMRTSVLNIGEKIFHVVFVVGLVAGAASAVTSGLAVGGFAGLLVALPQLLLSWSGTLIVALIVYALLDIRHAANGCSGRDSKTSEAHQEKCTKHEHNEFHKPIMDTM